MKSVFLTAACAALLFSVATAQAQTDTTQAAPTAAPTSTRPTFEKSMTGYGVSMGFPNYANPEESFVSPQASFHMLFRQNGLRIEPEVSVFQYEQTVTDDYYGYEQTAKITAFRLGAGVFSGRRHSATEVYWGVRAGVLREAWEVELDGGSSSESIEATRTSIYAGPAMGAEHFLSPRFSLGAEGQLIYTIFGDLESDDDNISSYEDVTQLDTRAYLFVRWYL